MSDEAKIILKDMQIEEMRKEIISQDQFIAQLEKEYDKEIERLNNIINKKEQFLGDNIKRLEREVVKRDNIINEIEKMMKNDLECACSMNENGLFNGAIDILEVYLDKLQELKESDK